MNFTQIAQYLYDYSGIPATCFVADELFHLTMGQPYLRRLVQHAPAELFRPNCPVHCFFTEETLCYGFVHVKKSSHTVIFGPVAAGSCDNRKAQLILRRLGLPTTEAGQLLSYFQQVPSCSYHKFAHFIIFACYILNGETVNLEQLLPEDYHFHDESPATSIVQPSTRTRHDAQSYENEMFSMIRFGKYEQMLEFLNHSSYTGNEGILADDMLRHQKNLIIASTTLSSRCAVGGGVDYDTSMSLADAYIQKVELAPNMKTLVALHKNMLKTYTRLVWEKKHNNANTSLSAKVHLYVEHHIAEKLSGQILADALQINRSYLSSQFKKETGTNLNDFVLQMKMDESKRLLLTTKQPISEISNLLLFSNQSYFQTLFKKLNGVTPLEFRKGKNSGSAPS